MTDIESQNTPQDASKDSLPENNFDKLQKTYPQYSDTIQFITTHEKTKDNKEVQEALSKTILTLAQENILNNMNDFWNNIEQVTKDLLGEDRIIDDIATLEQTENIFVFRTAFEKIKKQDNNEQKIDNKEQTIESINKKREELETRYSQIDDKYKPKVTQDKNEIEDTKNNHPGEQKALNELNISAKKQDLYFSYLYASEKIINESQDKKLSKDNYQFVEGFISLNKKLGVESSISLDGFDIIEDEIDEPTDKNKKADVTERSMEDIVHNENLGTELAENNSDIGDFVLDSSNDTFENKDIEENSDATKVIGEKLGVRYKDEIQSSVQQLLGKNKLTTYRENFDDAGRLINDEKIPDKDKEKLQKISEKIINTFSAKAQEQVLQDTNKVIKTKAVGALLQNIGKYFQIDNFAKDFAIDLKSGIEFNDKELKLSGTMEGKKMSFYYDMDTGEVFANDFVHYNKEDETFYINRGSEDKKGREKLKIPGNMPTLQNALDESKIAHLQAMPDALEKSDNLDEYQKNLNETSFTIDTKSNVADIVIEHSMAKNIAIQETQEFLKEYTPEKNTYSKDKEVREYNLYKIIDTSMDRYTVNEINQWKNLMNRFGKKMNENDNLQDQMIKSMFNDETKKIDTEGKYDKETGPNIYQFIHGITYEQPGTTKNNVIDLNFFGSIVSRLESNDSDTSKMENKSQKYIKLETDRETKVDQASADQLLNNDARNNTIA